MFKSYFLFLVLFIYFTKSQTIDPIYLNKAEVEKILGGPVAITENSMDVRSGISITKFTFTENITKSNLYYNYEIYNSPEVARKLIEDFIISNQNNEGFELIKNIGDSAFYLTDTNNFIIFIGVKGNIMIRMKVNKVNKKTSFVEFKNTFKHLKF